VFILELPRKQRGKTNLDRKMHVADNAHDVTRVLTNTTRSAVVPWVGTIPGKINTQTTKTIGNNKG
jgi:hypothetical protein